MEAAGQVELVVERRDRRVPRLKFGELTRPEACFRDVHPRGEGVVGGGLIGVVGDPREVAPEIEHGEARRGRRRGVAAVGAVAAVAAVAAVGGGVTRGIGRVRRGAGEQDQRKRGEGQRGLSGEAGL